ncbi:hypothetical protein M8C21_029485, partial [Ambrosia artemisiifolia]
MILTQKLKISATNSWMSSVSKATTRNLGMERFEGSDSLAAYLFVSLNFGLRFNKSRIKVL